MAYHERLTFLLHSDIKQLKQLSQVDKLSQSICNNNIEFWQCYFYKNEIKILGQYKTSYDWIKAFMVSQKAQSMIQHLDFKYRKYHIIFFNIGKDIFSQFISPIDKTYIHETCIKYCNNNIYELHYSYNQSLDFKYGKTIIYNLDSLFVLFNNLLLNHIPYVYSYHN